MQRGKNTRGSYKKGFFSDPTPGVGTPILNSLPLNIVIDKSPLKRGRLPPCAREGPESIQGEAVLCSALSGGLWGILGLRTR